MPSESSNKPTVGDMQIPASINSVFVRDLEGQIHSWNRAAEHRYGWKAQDAIGNVSHLLLNTVFPDALQEINQLLVENGYWEGELIHTLSNGKRVKVWSRWELQPSQDTGASAVIETNSAFTQLAPESAYFSSSRSTKLISAFRRAAWWILPLLVALAFIATLLLLTMKHPVASVLEHHAAKGSAANLPQMAAH